MERPTATVFLLEEVRLDVSDAPLDFAQANRGAIEAYWAEALAANPALWNGPAFLFSRVEAGQGVLDATAHRTDFATFLYWRDCGRPDSAFHITGSSLPVTADGALFAVRMAAHTANAGKVYFPAGSFDDADLVESRLDVTANIAREMREETGFDFGDADDGFVATFDRNAFYIARRSHLPVGFDEAVARFRAHQAATGDDEAETAVAIRRDDGSTDRLPAHARALARWHFANPRAMP